MLSNILRPSFTAVTIVEKLSSTNIISDTLFDTSVPAIPIPTPMLALFNAGASFTPSPVIATTLLFCFQAFTIASLFIGLTLAYTVYLFTFFINSSSLISSISVPSIASLSVSNIPISLAIEVAVDKLSPVIIIGLI